MLHSRDMGLTVTCCAEDNDFHSLLRVIGACGELGFSSLVLASSSTHLPPLRKGGKMRSSSTSGDFFEVKVLLFVVCYLCMLNKY